MTMNPRSGRWLAALTVAAVVAAGVWVTGGLITDDYKVSMGLTAAWFAISAAGALAIGVKRRPLLVPLVAGYLVTAVVVGGFLAWTTLNDRVVDEQVATGQTVASGHFESLEHESTGVASVVRRPDGRHVLTLTDFVTSAGPDLRVRLVVGDTPDGASEGAIDLGELKGNKGDQQYELPVDADLDRYTTVVIWCRAFSAPFGKANLS